MRPIDLLSTPAGLALAALLLRVAYAIVSRLVQPYPRARAAVEAVAALLPDVARAALQLVAVSTGRPAPRLDALPPDPRDEELAALRARVADLERRTVTLVPDGSETSRVVTRRLRAPESGRAEEAAVVVVLVLAVLLPLAVAVAGCGPRLPPVSGCAPLSQRCDGDRPQVCSPSQRWHVVGDEPCGASPGQSCTVVGGVAACRRSEGGR